MKKLLTILSLLTAFACANKITMEESKIEKDTPKIEVNVVLPKAGEKEGKSIKEIFEKVETKVNETIEALEKNSENATMKSAFYSSYKMYNNDKLGIKSYVITTEKHEGGANPEIKLEVINIDKDGKEVDLSKYVTEEVKQAVSKKLEEKGFEVDLTQAQFLFKDNKLHVVFAPETVAARSEGTIELEAQ